MIGEITEKIWIGNYVIHNGKKMKKKQTATPSSAEP